MADTAAVDFILPFQLEGVAVRGRVVRLGPEIDRIVWQGRYPEPVATLLAEAMVLASLLAGALKYTGVFTLQTKGDGPIRLLVADVTSDGALRGYAQFDEERLAAAASKSGGVVPRLLGAGYLAFTVDQGEDTERYQGIVALEGASLSECAHHYFRQSEQIETGIVVSAMNGAGGWRAGGIMLQRLPEENPDYTGDIEGAEVEDDFWLHALSLIGTCSVAELTDESLAPETLLFRLFHEQGVRAWPSRALFARCRCSRERLTDVLGSFSPEELADLVIDGAITVTCEFCDASYVFTPGELVAAQN